MYEGEFESLTPQHDVCPCADARRTKYYLARLKKELGGTEDMGSMAKAIHGAALLVHASNLGEPYWPSLALLVEQGLLLDNDQDRPKNLKRLYCWIVCGDRR